MGDKGYTFYCLSSDCEHARVFYKSEDIDKHLTLKHQVISKNTFETKIKEIFSAILKARTNLLQTVQDLISSVIFQSLQDLPDFQLLKQYIVEKIDSGSTLLNSNEVLKYATLLNYSHNSVCQQTQSFYNKCNSLREELMKFFSQHTQIPLMAPPIAPIQTYPQPQPQQHQQQQEPQQQQQQQPRQVNPLQFSQDLQLPTISMIRSNSCHPFNQTPTHLPQEVLISFLPAIGEEEFKYCARLTKFEAKVGPYIPKKEWACVMHAGEDEQIVYIQGDLKQNSIAKFQIQKEKVKIGLVDTSRYSTLEKKIGMYFMDAAGSMHKVSITSLLKVGGRGGEANIYFRQQEEKPCGQNPTD